MTTITSSGLGTTVTQEGTTHNITGGTRPGNGSNLFHSFGLFNLPGSADIANFNNETGLATSNILGRVTGGQRSSIFGTIQTTDFGAANLFLINPAGWIFGPTASLNVGGSFHVSTADYIRLSDGVLFNATPGPADALLTTAPPAAFGFLGSPVCVSPCISVDGGFLGGFLQVPEGQTLSLVGGDVQITGGATLFAPSGRVQIASVASRGEVTIPDLNVGSFSQLGKIDINSGSSINVSGDFSGGGAGGTVLIRGGQLFVDNSTITSETVGEIGGASTGIDIQVVDSVEFTNGTSITTTASGTGRGGNIDVKAASLRMSGGGTILSQTFGDGQSGNVSLTVDGAAEIAGSSISTANFGAGLPGDILVNVGALTLTDQSTIQAGLFSGNDGANVTVTARDSILISNRSGISSQSFLSNVGQVVIAAPTASLTIDNGFISTGTLETVNAGDISVNVQSLTLTGGSQIASSNIFQATGSGGNVTINANSVSISGTSPTGVSVLPTPFGDFVKNPNSGIFSAAFSESPMAGPGGTITLSSPTLTMSDGGTISVATVGGGRAGNIAVNVSDFTLASNARIDSSTTAAGAGGNLNVSAATVNIGGAGSGLFTTASSTGNAGEITVSAPALTMGDGGVISVATGGAGAAGSILLNVNNLSLAGGAQIVSSTTSEGNGGNLAITATESMSISGRSGSQASGLFSTASTASSSGNAGQISVLTPKLAMGESGTISVATEGSGSAGGIFLNVSNFTQTGGARVESSTTGAGAGGTLELTASELVSISGTGSGLFSTASNTGNAGQIRVTAPGSTPVPTLTMADGGKISVETTGAGRAGSILLNANNLNLAGGAQVVSSTSGSGLGGSVTANAANSISISGSGTAASGLFSTAESTGNAGQIAVTTPTLTMGESGTISVATFGAGNAGNVLLNVSNFTQSGGARVDSSTGGSGLGGDLTVKAANSASISGPGTGLFSTAAASETGNAGQISVTAPTLAMNSGGTISVETLGRGNAGNISLNVSEFTQTGGARVESSTSGGGAGGTLGLTASELVSISGAGSGLFSTAESTGKAGQITVTAPALAPVPTLTMADGGTISVATSGAGSAGSILLNANNFSLTGGAQVVSSTSGSGQGGSVTATATESASFSGLDSGLLSTASSTGNAGQVTVSTPTLAMANGGTISVATSNIGNAGSISLNVSEFTQTGGSRVESSTSGGGAGGTLGLTASELVSISGTGSGLFSTAEGTGNAGQVTVAAPGSTPVPTLSIADGGKISVETLGAGSAGSVLLNANTLSLTGGAQVVSNTTGAGQGGSVTATAANSISVSGSGSEPSGLFSTASSTGNAGQVSVSTPTLTMGDGGTISVATSGAGNAGNVLLNVSNFNLTGGAQIVSSTSGSGQGGSVSANATDSASISGQGTGLFSTASGTGAGGTINLQAAQLQITDLGLVSANSTGTATATAGNVNIVAGELVQMQNGSITTESTLADGGNISITTTGSMVRLNDSQITTSVQSGVGSGGNITIGSEFVLLHNSQIRADAFGGPGGNINIVADTFLPSNSLVSASSALSTPGTIAIEATFTDVTGSFAQLPSTPLEATELLRASCAARFTGGKASSLVVGGRDGLPLQPGGLLPSPLYVADSSTATKSITQEIPLRFTLLGSKDRLSNQYSLLPNMKCSL